MKRCLAFFSLTFAAGAYAQKDVRPVEGLHENDPQLHALVGGTIVSPQGESPGTVLIRDGRFAAVGAEVAVPEGARVWDVSGKRIYPGLIEPWWQMAPGGAEKGPHWNSRVRPERRIAEGYTIDDDALEARRKLGFSVAQLVPDKGIFRGQAGVILLRNGKRGEQVIEPSSGQVVDFATGSGYPNSLMGAVALVRQTFSDAVWYKNAGEAHAANPGQVERPANDPALAALSHRGAVLWRARDELDYGRIARVADEFHLQPTVLGNGHEYRRIARLAELGAPLLLPLNYPRRPAIEDAAAALDYSLAELQHWELAASNASLLAREKLPFAFTAHGVEDMKDNFWDNVRKAVERGLPSGLALDALTERGAKILGIADRCGAIQPGLFANLFVAEGDPFSDEKSVIEVTWVEGVPYVFHDATKPDASGVWEFSGLEGGAPTRWEIGGQGEPKVKVGETEFKARWKGGDLLLFPPATLFGLQEGTARMSGSFDAENGKLTGVAALPGGGAFWWSAKRSGDADEESAEDEKDGDEEGDEDPSSFVFTSYPAGAYGLEAGPERPAALLVRGATIWTCAEAGVIEGADLLVAGGKILKVGKDLQAPDGTVTIDGSGKHVTPGLIDCHSHTAISRGVNESTHAVTVEVRIGDSLDPTSISLYRQLGGGLTTANLLHGSANPMGGQNQVIKLRWGGDADGLRFEGAKPGVKFALGENVKQSNWDRRTDRYPQTRMGVEQIMKDSFVAARDYRAERNRDIQAGKPHRRDLRMDALLEILDGRRIVHIHSYRQDEILMFVRLAQEFGFSVGTFQHVLEGYKVADEIASIGAGGSSFSDWWAYKFEVEDAIPFNGALLHQAGVVTSFNSDDSELACRMNAEAAKAVKYGGVSAEEALKFVTINPAKQLRIDGRVGSLEKGKDADFVIWNASPLSTYARAEQTWIDGRCYFSLERDAELRKSAAEERERLVAKILAKAISSKEKEKSEDGEEREGEGEGEDEEFEPGSPRRLPWLPAWVGGACTSADRGLYHNGKNEHTCTGAACCGIR